MTPTTRHNDSNYRAAVHRAAATRRFAVAAPMLAAAAALTLAASGAPVDADFQKRAVPFIEKHCVECHGKKSTKAGLNLVKLDKSDSAVLKDRKVWLSMLTQVGAGEMPPTKQPRPTPAEVTAFTAAVESAMERAEVKMPLDPGRITIRRLNRNEYLNTVRELLMVDFNPTEDFPADDIGHGFDNIADVLTVSPLLMERYLDAAESIAQRVIVEIPPKPAVRYLSGRFLQPNNAQTPQGRFRPMDPAVADPVISGPFAAPGDYLKFSADADLAFRATLYAEPRGASPVKVALFIQGGKLPDPSSDEEIAQLMGAALPSMKPLKILKTFEITARDAAKPQRIEIPINRIGNINRAGIAVLKPPAGEEPPKLFIEHLWSEGPMETRPASQLKILACAPDKPRAGQTREVLQRLLLRAYRRPPTATEVESMARIVAQAVASGRKWEGGMQVAISALLCSPKFLFRVELDDRPLAREPHPLDEFQLASRLSYFLWSSMPDDELLDLAGKKQLTANLDAQVRRMLKDPRSDALVQNFALQWLQVKRLQTSVPDTKLFPQFNEPLRKAMLRETELFFAEIMRGDRSVLDLIDADFTYVNDALARLYGLTPGGTGAGGRGFGRGFGGSQEFRRVALTSKERGGLLSHASVLTVTSNPTRTSPVKRGRWVLEQLLGTPPPPPPPNVPELDGQKKLTGTLRQRMEQHRENPACASCHTQMDAMGFALENFNAVGAWRATDGEAKIDASGTLPDGRSFNGPAELKAVLREKKELFARNLTEKMLTYSLGRGLEYYDARAVRQITAQLAKDDYKFSALVAAIVKSDPFRLRRGRELNDKNAAAE